MSGPTTRFSRSRGLTLVELMVALLIGVVLVGGVTMIFFSGQESYRLNEAVSRLQENGRYGIDAIARDLRMAGLPSCLVRQGIVVNRLQGTPDVLNVDEPVDGWEANGTAPGATRQLNFGAALQAVPGGDWSTIAGTAITGLTAMPGADVLRVRRLVEAPPRISDIVTGAGQTVVTVTQTAAISDGDIFVMCNGDTGQGFIVQSCSVDTVLDPFGVTATAATLSAGCAPGNQVPLDLGVTVWGDAGHLAIPREVVYFIAKRGGNAGNSPALFRRVDGPAGNGVAEELVEGVESMQILYGIDTSGNLQANEYVPANLVQRWDEVVAVRIGLLLVSTDNNVAPPEQNDIALLGTSFEPPADDRRLRQTMTATVTLRNQAP